MADAEPIIREFGWPAADFALDGVDGKRHHLEDVRGPQGTVVMFICNHCPYVRATIADIVGDCRALAAEGVGAVAVMPNDTHAYPADSFDNMVRFVQENRLDFPYVIDETQETARAYGAICTPDFFGFDRDLALRYHGRLYETAGRQPKAGARHELLEAMRRIAQTGRGPEEQTPSIGCTIKWRH